MSLLQKPSLGGWLTIANLLAWLLLVGIVKLGVPVPKFVFLAYWLLLSIPLASCCLLPKLGPPSTVEIIASIVALVINAFVWGYGLAWFLQRATRRRERLL